MLYISLADHASPTREPSFYQSTPTLTRGCDEGVNLKIGCKNNKL